MAANNSSLHSSLRHTDDVVDHRNVSVTYRDPGVVMLSVEMYAIPVIAIFGLISNTISFVVFTSRSMRNNSCSIFLAARSLSDNGFLGFLLTIWASSTFNLQLGDIPGVCQMMLSLTYVFGCLSVWFVVLVTAENYVRICKPLLVKTMCKVFTAKAIVLLLTLVTLGLYSFPFWAMENQCVPLDAYVDFIKGMIYVDSVITLVIPCILMLVLILAIGLSTVKSFKRRRRLSVSSINMSKSPVTKVARMLLAVTLLFFCLNIPSHTVRLRFAIQMYMQEYVDLTSADVVVQSASLLLYYLSLAINIFAYYCFGSKFRVVFKEIILCQKRPFSMSGKALSAQRLLQPRRFSEDLPRTSMHSMISLSDPRVNRAPVRKLSSVF